ncbi:39S ribosomal protein L38, mitochondrial-like isoform X1 [Varroa destructor]|uniref:Large ribosomal subunit protein mL38 n=1 Tax=Varroa destructor TaxID=109461 RepID=A0A7M7KQP5_VARDE|nr:39S ribosomal protein L38, mitochondrial-like isoform X1 [Varroa destructor]
MLRTVRQLSKQPPALTRGLRGLIPELAPTLEQRMEMLNPWNQELHARVNIGFYERWKTPQSKKLAKQRLAQWKILKRNHERMALAKSGKLLLDYDKQKEIWAEGNFRTHIKLAADHYKIFHDLYEYGYFFPTTVLNVRYPLNEEEFAPVYMGNIMSASDTASVPEVAYAAEEGELFTLVMTSLDSHLEVPQNEYLHWLLTNIPGNDISKGTSICDYMRPFVPKGAGYHRFVFVLYKHMKGEIDLSDEKRTPKTASLRERTFRTLDFYRKYQDTLTPCAISFFQCKWDDSLMDFFHNILEMKVPVFEHIPLDKDKLRFKKWPEGESFNEYIDLFRDEKEIAEEVYCKRLKALNPFQEESSGLKFPHAHAFPQGTPSWYRTEISRERSKMGKYRHLRRFSLYEGSEEVNVKPYDRYGPLEE